ncbi:pro-opiomelanocortin-like [Lethenteron reissneri]|uniref:pro-opiomelanocortin-like n=1 Tax=Lethenteron reissneri TaxID=7753 RepID=UPI002AB6A3D4|nr:pro-opiomelanocortin-like [Lethenteron reissneri]
MMEWPLVRLLGAALVCLAPRGGAAVGVGPCLGVDQLSDPAAQFLCSRACNGDCGAWLLPERAALTEEADARGAQGERPGPEAWGQQAGNDELVDEVMEDEVMENEEEPLRRSLGYAVGHFRWGKPANRKKRPVKVFVEPGSEDFQDLSERAIISNSDLQPHQHEQQQQHHHHQQQQQQQHRHHQVEQNAITAAEASRAIASSWPWILSPGAVPMAGAAEIGGPLWSQDEMGLGPRRQSKRYGGFQVHSEPPVAKTPLMVLFKMFKGRDGKSQ